MQSSMSISVILLMCMLSLSNACASKKKLPIPVCGLDPPVDASNATSTTTGTVPKVTEPVPNPAEVTSSSSTTRTTTTTTPTTPEPTTTTTPEPTTTTMVTTTTEPATTTPNCKTVKCPEGYKEHQNKCYRFITTGNANAPTKAGYDYRTDCENLAGTGNKGFLASFHDQATVDFFVSLTKAERKEVVATSTNKNDMTRFKTVVVGMIRKAGESVQFEDGTAAPPGVLQWAPSEPHSNEDGKKNRISMAVGVDYLKDGQLMEWGDHWYTGAICQMTHPGCPEDPKNVKPKCKPITGTGKCPKDWKYYKEGEMCYFEPADQDLQSFDQHEAHCVTLQAHLPAVHSEHQAAFIRKLVGDKNWLIGAKSTVGNVARYEKFLDGSAIDYGNWDTPSYEKTTETKQHCVYEDVSSKKWKNGACDDTIQEHRMVCAQPATGVVFQPPGCIFNGKVMP